MTGAADPTVSLKDTLKGKLPQRKIVTGAAKGYSSYGNQIGLRQVLSMKFIIRTMWQNVWKSVQLWALRQEKML